MSDLIEGHFSVAISVDTIIDQNVMQKNTEALLVSS